LVTVLLNLLDNACKFTGEPKQIVLRAFGEDDHVSFAVSDNGIGIPLPEQKRVFRSFYQVDRRLSREAGDAVWG
jgi:signal transduction histidine kinase